MLALGQELTALAAGQGQFHQRQRVIDFGLPAEPAASRRLSRDQDLREENKGKINSERSLAAAAAAVPGIWVLVVVSQGVLPACRGKKGALHSWGSALSLWKELRDPFLSQMMGW